MTITCLPPEAELVAQYTGLIRHLANKVARRCHYRVDADDLHSEGVIGLLAAARTFDEDKGASFTTHAARRIQGAMLDAIRDNDWPKRRTRLVIAKSGGEPVRMVQGEADAIDQRTPYQSAAQADSVRALTRHMSREQRFVVLSSVVHGLDTADIAKSLGTTRGNVAYIKCTALKTLRGRLSGTMKAMSQDG